MVPKDKHPKPPSYVHGAADESGPSSAGRGHPSPVRPGAVPSQAFTEPPRRRDRLGVWLLLALCMVLAAPGMLIELHKPDVTNQTEAQNVATSIQSWRRYTQLAGVPGSGMDRFVPYLNGQPRLKQPPGLTWLHWTAFAIPVSPEMTTDGLVLRARLVSVAVALLSVAGVYWAGLSVGGMAAGLFGALVYAANPVFVYYARLGSDSIHQAAWVLLSVASALWAIRPLKPASGVVRQAIGWGCCGLALGVATLTVGPKALPEVCVPVLLVLVLCPSRINHVMGLLAALLIGLLMILPWAGHVQGQVPEIWNTWLGQLLPWKGSHGMGVSSQTGRQLGVAMLVLLPWTPWLIGAVVQPLSASSEGLRGRLWLGLVWFVSVCIMCLLWFNAEQIQDMLMMGPPFAVLIGQLFKQYTDLAAQGRFARFWRWLRWPHVALLLAASVVIPALLNAQLALVRRGTLGQQITASVSWTIAAGMGVVLLLTIGLSIRWALKQHPDRALVSWAGWALMLVWMVAVPAVRGPLAANPIRDDVKQLRQLTDADPVYWLAGRDPSADLLLYFDRPVRCVTADQISGLASQHGRMFLLTPAGQAPAVGTGFETATHLSHLGMDLWRFRVVDRTGKPSPT